MLQLSYYTTDKIVLKDNFDFKVIGKKIMKQLHDLNMTVDKHGSV